MIDIKEVERKLLDFFHFLYNLISLFHKTSLHNKCIKLYCKANLRKSNWMESKLMSVNKVIKTIEW